MTALWKSLSSDPTNKRGPLKRPNGAWALDG
jgi:hypothetical protein